MITSRQAQSYVYPMSLIALKGVQNTHLYKHI